MAKLESFLVVFVDWWSVFGWSKEQNKYGVEQSERWRFEEEGFCLRRFMRFAYWYVVRGEALERKKLGI
jgi:hypothetical protein